MYPWNKRDTHIVGWLFVIFVKYYTEITQKIIWVVEFWSVVIDDELGLSDFVSTDFLDLFKPISFIFNKIRRENK